MIFPKGQRTRTVVLILLAPAALIFIVWVFYNTATAPSLTVEPSPKNAAALRDSYVKLIDGIGPEKAYADFKDRYVNADFSAKHNAAHLFGQALFIHEGLTGVGYCDSDFNFGCYHGFFVSAISASGISVVPQLDAACSSSRRTTACQHGLGHGLIDFFGPEHLEKALDACTLTNQPDPIAGCTSGVFMEYNVPFETNKNGTYTPIARTLSNPNRPYDPCPSLPAQFQLSCYHELPQWWGQVFKSDVAKMAALCAAADTFTHQETCVHGLGSVIPSLALYDATKAVALCTLIPTRQFQSRCFMSAAGAFRSNNGLLEAAHTLCKEADTEDQVSCIR